MKPGYAKMLQTLYDNELNFKLWSEWDAGFQWEFKNVGGSTRTAAEAIERIWDAAITYSFSLEDQKLHSSLLLEVYSHD